MSQENVEIVRVMASANVEIAQRVIDAFNRRDVDAIFECVNHDVE
jgi:hypothetical protein